LEAAERPEPTVFRVRAGRVDEGELLDRLAHRGFRVRPVPGLAGFHQVESAPYPLSLTLEHWAGLVYVQQASTGVAAPQLGAAPGERVLDMCAAPGGKTSHLAELMGDRGCLVAAEVDDRRIRGLLGNLYRLCHPNVLCVRSDGRDFPEGALFDRVLVDAPCSGEGTLRRRSGEAPNPSESFRGHVTRVQRALLRRAVRLCRPGGTILYVTCTFSPLENEAVVSDVLSDGEADLEPLALETPHEPGLTRFEGETYDARLSGAARIYPYHLDSGGLFLAKLRRLGPAPAETERRTGWRSVPFFFPGESASEDGVRDRMSAALRGMSERYGLTPNEVDRWRWTVRGGKAWLHTVEEWPLPSWPEGSWRPVSIGVRAIEFDSRERPRPTNDFLRIVGSDIRSGRVEPTHRELMRLLAGDRVAGEATPPGPVAIGFEGLVLGRGMAGADGIVSEIPKARAADLRRILSEAPEVGGEESVGGSQRQPGDL